MLERLYATNYRCLVNFEFQPAAKQLLIGRNGAGKTTVLDVLVMLRDFAARGLPCEGQLMGKTRTLWQDVAEQRFNEPIVVLIPKRRVETWIRSLLGNEVDEVTNYTKAPYKPPSTEGIKNAAAKLYEWTRPGADAPASSPPSLTSSIPEWRKIP